MKLDISNNRGKTMPTNLNKKIIFSLFFSFSSFISFAGTSFFALHIPGDLKKELIEIQKFISDKVPEGVKFEPSKDQNLHVTLKEIGNLDSAEIRGIVKSFKPFAKKYHPFNITDAVHNAHLKITSTGLILFILKQNKSLTNLAVNIDKELHCLHSAKQFKELFDRMDFPNKGHITLGQLQVKEGTKLSDYEKDLDQLVKNFKNQVKSLFQVNSFVLLRSNRPAVPRIYYQKGTFKLAAKSKLKKASTKSKIGKPKTEEKKKRSCD